MALKVKPSTSRRWRINAWRCSRSVMGAPTALIHNRYAPVEPQERYHSRNPAGVTTSGTRGAHRVYYTCGDGFTAPLTMTLAGLFYTGPDFREAHSPAARGTPAASTASRDARYHHLRRCREMRGRASGAFRDRLRPCCVGRGIVLYDMLLMERIFRWLRRSCYTNLQTHHTTRRAP
jgi:hypothetical protein